MKTKIQNPSFEQVKDYLGKIGWSFHNHGCDHWGLYDHNDKYTGFMLLFPKTDARFEAREIGESESINVVFYLRECEMDFIGDEGNEDAVSFEVIGRNGVFLICMNHDVPRKEVRPERKKKSNA